MSLSIESIKAVLILDHNGDRLLAKYYDGSWSTVKEQKNFEKALFKKTHKANSEITMFDGNTAVYRTNMDLLFYVIGPVDGNELLLTDVLNGFYESVAFLLRNQVEKRSLIDNMDVILMTLDEVIDNGMILEVDPSVISQRVALRPFSEDSPTDQTLGQALSSARDQLVRSLLK